MKWIEAIVKNFTSKAAIRVGVMLYDFTIEFWSKFWCARLLKVSFCDRVINNRPLSSREFKNNLNGIRMIYKHVVIWRGWSFLHSLYIHLADWNAIKARLVFRGVWKGKLPNMIFCFIHILIVFSFLVVMGGGGGGVDGKYRLNSKQLLFQNCHKFQKTLSEVRLKCISLGVTLWSLVTKRSITLDLFYRMFALYFRHYSFSI